MYCILLSGPFLVPVSGGTSQPPPLPGYRGDSSDGLAPLPEPIEPNRISSCQMKKTKCSNQVGEKEEMSPSYFYWFSFTPRRVYHLCSALLARAVICFPDAVSLFSVFINPNATRARVRARAATVSGSVISGNTVLDAGVISIPSCDKKNRLTCIFLNVASYFINSCDTCAKSLAGMCVCVSVCVVTVLPCTNSRSHI